MKKTIILFSLFAIMTLNASAQGGKGKFLTRYNSQGQEEYKSSAGVSFIRDEQEKRYAWQPSDAPCATYSSLGEIFDIKNVKSITRYIESDNQFTVELPQESNLTNDDIIVKAYGEEIAPSEDNHYSTGAGYVSVVNKDGKIIYDSYLTLDSIDDTRTVKVNALETAYTLLIPIFPFVFEPTSDQIFASLKSLLAELPETHALSNAIDRSIIMNGYLEIDDINAEYDAAVERIIEKMGLRDNYLNPNENHTRHSASAPAKVGYDNPYVVSGNDISGLKLVMNSSEYLYYLYSWKCSFTAYNSNRFAYTAWVRGYKSNGYAYYYDEDLATMMKNILAPQRVSTFMGTFTTWDGIKRYWSDTYKLFAEEDFGFDDMTWDNTKIDFDMYFDSQKDVVIVAGPGDDTFMLYYNILKVVMSPVVKAFSKGLNKNAELYQSDYLIPFITDLLADPDYQLKFKIIYEGDGSLGEKAGEIMDLTWPKFEKYIMKFAKDQLSIGAEYASLKYFGFFTTAQLRKAMEDIGKNWNKYLKIVEKAGDVTLGVLGLQERSTYFNLALDFGESKNLLLETYEVSIPCGSQKIVKIISGNGKYSVVSSNPQKAEAVVEGLASTASGNEMGVKITAVDKGECNIVVTDYMTKQTATIKVTVISNDTTCPDDHHPHLIDLGLPSGTKWACCNVGATKPVEYGGYFAWGETEEKDVYNEDTYKYYQNGSYVNLGSDISGTEYDVAHVKWGGNWCMPTLDDIKELFDNCDSEWTTLNGVNGRNFTSKINGNSIFLPAAGYRWDGDLRWAGEYGSYWSSQPPEISGLTYVLYFASSDAHWSGDIRFCGQNVRPVVRN